MKNGWWLALAIVLLAAYFAYVQPTASTPVGPPVDVGADLPTQRQLTFHGYDCTDDCSGHRAGYEWAEEHDITDADDCGGNSQSFIEGCKAYAGEDGDDDDGDEQD